MQCCGAACLTATPQLANLVFASREWRLRVQLYSLTLGPAAFLRPDLASREELQQRLAARVAALRAARHAEERKKQTEAAKRFRATNGHVEKKARLLMCYAVDCGTPAVSSRLSPSATWWTGMREGCPLLLKASWIAGSNVISAHQVVVKRKRGAQADDGKGVGSPKTPHLSAADFQK